ARPSENWTAERVKRMFGTAETDIQIQPTPIWVHLTYQTAFVEDGKLQIRRDVYNLDSRTLAAIRSERGMVEPLQERKREEEIASLQRRIVIPQRTVTSFFESLFGGPSYGSRPVPQRRVDGRSPTPRPAAPVPR